MKKTFALSLMATALLSSTGAAVAATENVGGGRVDFEGQVTGVSCTISVNGQGSDASVSLAPVSAAEITSNDTLYKATPFNIRVSNCSNDFALSWVGGNLYGSNGYLANSSAGADAAANVQLAISSTDSISGKIRPGFDNGTRATAADESFQYYVGYVSDDYANIAPGSVRSYATYLVNYQ